MPEKTAKKITVELPGELTEALMTRKQQTGQSLRGVVIAALTDYLKKPVTITAPAAKL